MPPEDSRSSGNLVRTPKKVAETNTIGEKPTIREGLSDTNQDAQELRLAPLLTTPNHRSSPTYVRTPGFPIDNEVQISPELWQPALPDSPEPISIGLWDPANYHPRTPGLSPVQDQKAFGEALLSPLSKELGRLAWGSPFSPASPRMMTGRIESSPATGGWETLMASTSGSDGRRRRWSMPSSRVDDHDDIAEWVERQLELAVEAQDARRQ